MLIAYAFRLTAKLEHEGSGRMLEVFTDQPGVQFYTDNFMPTDGSFVGKGGAVYQVIKNMVVFSGLNYSKYFTTFEFVE